MSNHLNNAHENFMSALKGDKFNWEIAAEKFFIAMSVSSVQIDGGSRVYIESKEQRDGSVKWAVYMDGHCLTKKLKFVYEPSPSGRTEKFIESTRFASKEEALEAIIKYEKKYRVNS